MKTRPLLSVCIPTFNRKDYLRECLDSIKKHGFDGSFEVVVSDNASSDGTVKLLNEYIDHLALRWIIQDKNIGANLNFDAVVAFAEGEYCWLLGSDDVIEPNAIKHIISLIKSLDTDILHFGYIQADIALNRLYPVYPTADYSASSQDALARYLGGMPNMSMLFTFISSFVFRRSLWMSRRDQVLEWAGTHYIHMFTIHSALTQGASLLRSDQCLILARGGNPNQFNSVPGRFMALDARTMSRLIREVYGDQAEFWLAISQPFRRSYPARSLLHIAANGGLGYIKEARETLLRFGYSKALLRGLELLHRLKLLGVIKVLQDSRRRVLKIFNFIGSLI